MNGNGKEMREVAQDAVKISVALLAQNEKLFKQLDRLTAEIGASGQIDSKHPEVLAAMDLLAEIDPK